MFTRVFPDRREWVSYLKLNVPPKRVGEFIIAHQEKLSKKFKAATNSNQQVTFNYDIQIWGITPPDASYKN